MNCPFPRSSIFGASLKRFALLILCAVIATTLMTACASGTGPIPREPSKLDITVDATNAMNLDEKGRAAPMMVRIYELKSKQAFLEADFFSLQTKDKTVLGEDLLQKDEFILRPGETRKIKRPSMSETTALGVLAGYRDLPNSQWRVVHELPTAPPAAWYKIGNTVKLFLSLESDAIKVTEQK